MIDLDHNATTKPADEVIETIAYHMRNSYANPSSRHGLGKTARKVLEESREKIASLIHCQPEEIIFTSGGSESNNLALLGIPESSRKTLLATPGDHPSSAEVYEQLNSYGWNIEHFKINSEGQIQPETLKEIDWNSVGLVSLLYAHNETGVIQKIDSIADLCLEHQIPLHLDAVQAVGKIPVDFGKFKATSMSLAAHKFHGPRGIGALVVSKSLNLKPILFGGHQEAGMRPGTELAPLAAGMAKALELSVLDLENRASQMKKLRDLLEAGLREKCSPVVIHGENSKRLPNTLNISFPGMDGEAFLVSADLEGIACSLGSACASGSTKPSPVLTAMGYSEEIALSSVRFSVGVDNSEEEIHKAISIISGIVNRLRDL